MLTHTNPGLIHKYGFWRTLFVGVFAGEHKSRIVDQAPLGLGTIRREAQKNTSFLSGLAPGEIKYILKSLKVYSTQI